MQNNRILTFLLLPFFLFSQETERRLALVIGNSNYEKGELKKLADLSSYNVIKDSLSIILNQRIVAAKIRPTGLGRQINNARP